MSRLMRSIGMEIMDFIILNGLVTAVDKNLLVWTSPSEEQLTAKLTDIINLWRPTLSGNPTQAKFEWISVKEGCEILTLNGTELGSVMEIQSKKWLVCFYPDHCDHGHWIHVDTKDQAKQELERSFGL